MQAINIHTAMIQPSRLVDEAEAGKEMIVRAGKPVAKLVPLDPASITQWRVLGRLAGQLTVPTDFDAALPGRVLDAFEGP